MVVASRVYLFHVKELNLDWLFDRGDVDGNYELNFSGRYNGAFNTRGTNGGTQDPLALDDNIVVDFSAKYHLTSQISLTANVINLFDEV